ncbi:uncharacterized protein LOC141644037 [Silene latifolia]|uniref:uncharacterized protein LOC141644037 n=1 Tax=Silene latifolia TaxID=37657 RepID=UPI003D7875BF
MPKEFNIPPVSFPTPSPSTTPSTMNHPSTTTHPTTSPPLHHRTFPPTAPFPPPSSSSSSIPFMSFDISSHTQTPSSSAYPSSYPPPPPHNLSSSSLFLDEPSLLEELEINPTLIWRKTRSLLNPIRPDPTLHSSDPDLSGPFLYYLSLALFQLLAGKVQFGVILGWIAISSVFLYSVLNFLAGRGGNLDLYRCVSVVGYSLMPIVVFSAASLFLPPVGSSAVGLVVAGVFVVWATRLCSRLLAEDSIGCEEHRGLIAFPCFLIYTLFSMLVMF